MFCNNRVYIEEEQGQEEDPLENILHIEHDDSCGSIQTYTYIFLFISLIAGIIIFRK
jgi:hypothetical protein